MSQSSKTKSEERVSRDTLTELLRGTGCATQICAISARAFFHPGDHGYLFPPF